MLLTVLGALSGCMSPRIETSSTTFQGEGHAQRDTISVMPIDKTQEGSLEFKTVSDYLLGKFAEKGYIPSKNKDTKFVAFVTYGMDNGKTSMSSVPLFGQTGGGTSYSSGTVSSGTRTGSYSGTTTTMPTYGMIGAMSYDVTTYKRVVNIDIFRKNANQEPTKVYEIKGVSTGSCGNINSVLFSIIDGIFQNFPGENGKTKTVIVPWTGSC